MIIIGWQCPDRVSSRHRAAVLSERMARIVSQGGTAMYASQDNHVAASDQPGVWFTV